MTFENQLKEVKKKTELNNYSVSRYTEVSYVVIKMAMLGI